MMAQPLSNHPAEPDSRESRPPLTLLPTRDAERDALVRVLALDRLRELHDDGVTTDYMGRMYGVSGEYMAELESDLRRDRGSVSPTPRGVFD